MRIYSPLTSLNRLHFTDRITEGDAHATLFSKLVADGFLVKSQVTFSQQIREIGCSFDLVVYKDRHQASAIIEVKSPEEGPTTDLEASHQGLKYRSFGVPVILFWDMANYEELKSFLKGHVAQEVKLVARTKDSQALKRLAKSLDIASMSAYDLGMHDLVADLELKRDTAQEQLKQC